MSPAYSIQLWETPQVWVGLWLNELSASKSSLSIALSKSSRRLLKLSTSMQLTSPFERSVQLVLLKFHYHLFVSSHNSNDSILNYTYYMQTICFWYKVLSALSLVVLFQILKPILLVYELYILYASSSELKAIPTSGTITDWPGLLSA